MGQGEVLLREWEVSEEWKGGASKRKQEVTWRWKGEKGGEKEGRESEEQQGRRVRREKQ